MNALLLVHGTFPDFETRARLARRWWKGNSQPA
jgi:hypothetical protein